jgi:hypothetical protein
VRAWALSTRCSERERERGEGGRVNNSPSYTVRAWALSARAERRSICDERGSAERERETTTVQSLLPVGEA